jgi:hypothetical protein
MRNAVPGRAEKGLECAGGESGRLAARTAVQT